MKQHQLRYETLLFNLNYPFMDIIEFDCQDQHINEHKLKLQAIQLRLTGRKEIKDTYFTVYWYQK